MLEMKHSLKEVWNELLNIKNTASQMEERISDFKDKNLEMTQRKEEKDLRIKK